MAHESQRHHDGPARPRRAWRPLLAASQPMPWNPGPRLRRGAVFRHAAGAPWRPSRPGVDGQTQTPAGRRRRRRRRHRGQGLTGLRTDLGERLGEVSTATRASSAAAALQPCPAAASASLHAASAARSACSSMPGPARSTSPMPTTTPRAAARTQPGRFPAEAGRSAAHWGPCSCRRTGRAGCGASAPGRRRAPVRRPARAPAPTVRCPSPAAPTAFRARGPGAQGDRGGGEGGAEGEAGVGVELAGLAVVGPDGVDDAHQVGQAYGPLGSTPPPRGVRGCRGRRSGSGAGRRRCAGRRAPASTGRPAAPRPPRSGR